MRNFLVLVPLSLLGTPALAQNLPPPYYMPAPPVLADPAAVDRMGNAAEAVSRALLNVPIGEVRAAVQGREPTSRDRHDTLGRETGVTERDLHVQFEAAKPMIQHGAQAMARALPQIMRSLADVQSTIDRTMANLPDPNYPRR